MFLLVILAYILHCPMFVIWDLAQCVFLLTGCAGSLTHTQKHTGCCTGPDDQHSPAISINVAVETALRGFFLPLSSPRTNCCHQFPASCVDFKEMALDVPPVWMHLFGCKNLQIVSVWIFGQYLKQFLCFLCLLKHISWKCNDGKKQFTESWQNADLIKKKIVHCNFILLNRMWTNQRTLFMHRTAHEFYVHFSFSFGEKKIPQKSLKSPSERECVIILVDSTEQPRL